MTLPKAPKEVPVISDMTGLAPLFRAEIEGIVADMRAWGYTPRVFETLRTKERQTFLYGFGREYDDGRGIVTYSRTVNDTWHGFGLAVDIICAKRLWSAPRDFWEVLGCSARRRGLLWGGDWNNDWNTSDERFHDRPHIQWGKMRRSPSSQTVEIVTQGGLPSLWQAVKAS